MCWNAEVSIATFLFGVATLFLVGNDAEYTSRERTTLALFLFSFMAMQAVEYKLWTSTTPEMNRKWSQIGFMLIVLQPLASILRIPTPRIRNRFLVAYVFFLVGMIWFASRKSFHTSVAPSGHLQWKWLQFRGIEYGLPIAYLMLVFGPLILIGSWSGVLVSLVTLMFSMAFYMRDGTWGSMWCWTVNVVSVYFWWKFITHAS